MSVENWVTEDELLAMLGRGYQELQWTFTEGRAVVRLKCPDGAETHRSLQIVECDWCDGHIAGSFSGVCALSVSCPTCYRKPGQWCQRPSGHKAMDMHADRVAVEGAVPPIPRSDERAQLKLGV